MALSRVTDQNGDPESQVLSDNRIDHLASVNDPSSPIEKSPPRGNVGQIEATSSCSDAVIPKDPNLLVVRTAHENHRFDVLSPIRRLPIELVVEIFQLFCEGVDESYSECYKPRPHLSPLLLCQICSEWRQLAENTPTLWKDVVFRFPEQQTTVEEMLRVQPWIRRAGRSVPLNMFVEKVSPYSYHDKWLAPYSRRIRSLSLQGYIPPFTTCSFDTLQSLKLGPGKAHLTNSDVETIFRLAPLLQTVTLHGPEHGDIIFPWAQLRKLHLLYVVLRTELLERILSECVFLRHLVIYGHRTHPVLLVTTEFMRQTYAMPLLHSLSIRQIASWTAYHIICLVSFPALKYLELGDLRYFLGLDVQMDIRPCSLFRLERLVLERSPISLEAFLTILAATPSLLELRSSESVAVSTELFESLIFDDSSTVHLVPKLQSLSLGHSIGLCKKAPSDEAILNMIRSRWSVGHSVGSAVSRLRHISLNIEGWVVNGEMRKRLGEWEAEGLRVELCGAGEC